MYKFIFLKLTHYKYYLLSFELVQYGNLCSHWTIKLINTILWQGSVLLDFIFLVNCSTEFANRVLQHGPNPRAGKKSDQAHPPIHPTKHTTSLQGNWKWQSPHICICSVFCMHEHLLVCCLECRSCSAIFNWLMKATQDFIHSGFSGYEKKSLWSILASLQ
jgi:hypothetical protein